MSGSGFHIFVESKPKSSASDHTQLLRSGVISQTNYNVLHGQTYKKYYSNYQLKNDHLNRKCNLQN
jgi:hypothetical protein